MISKSPLQWRAAKTDAKKAEKDFRKEFDFGRFFADPRWRDLLSGDKFILVDVGATGGLQKEWVSATPLMKVIAFEPRPMAASLYSEIDAILLDVGLDKIPGERELHVAGGFSSCLQPDLEVWDRFGWPMPTGQLRVKTTTLDAVIRDQGLRFVDFLKLDTQGSELDILLGGPLTVRDMVIGMRIETSFIRHYHAQPLFADVDSHVQSQGFDLIDLIKLRRSQYAISNAVLGAELSDSRGQLLQADALYFRTPAGVADRIQAMSPPHDRVRYLTGALIACATYDKIGLGARYIDAAGSLIEPRDRSVMVELLRTAVP
jgi:FkbM family methyltransferase